MIDFKRRSGTLHRIWRGIASAGSDFIYTKSFARPRSGFYLHKEFRPAEILILSTQRISRGRDPNFLYTKNFIRKIMKIQ